MRNLMLVLVVGMLFVGCSKATPTSVVTVADQPQTPVEYVQQDTLLMTSATEDGWLVGPLLASGDGFLPNFGWHDGAFKFHMYIAKVDDVIDQSLSIGAWIWTGGIGVCYYDSIAVTGRVRMNLAYAKAEFKPGFGLRNNHFGYRTIQCESAAESTEIIRFETTIKPDQNGWNCGSGVKFFFFATLGGDIWEANPQARSSWVDVQIDSVEVRGFRKIPVQRD